MNIHTMHDCRIHLITGHYGSGKTNFSLNLAMALNEKKGKVCIIDLDIVNPYFRTADYSELLMPKGIEVLQPNYAGTNVDIPSISRAIYGAFSREDTYIIADIGGDDAGATVLGSLQQNIAFKTYAMYYVANRYRYLTRTADQAFKILQDIQHVSGLKANIVVNNSNLGELTKWEAIKQSESYGREIADKANIKTVIQTVPNFLKEDQALKLQNKEAVEVFSIKNWV